MAEPTGYDLHVNQLMTNISIGYKNEDLYIADKIFPILPVRKQSDIIPKYNQSHWFRNTAELRAPATKSRRGGFSVGSDTYYCSRYSFGFEIPDEFRDNADSPYDMDRDGTMFATDRIYLKRELSFVETVFQPSIWGADKTGAASGGDFVHWSDYATSTPLRDITDYMDGVEALTARPPNTAVMGKQVWSQLKWHPDLMDTIKYTQRGQVSTEILASLLEVDRVLIGRGIYTTTPEGTAEASVVYNRIWGKNVLFAYVPQSPSLFTPASGYTFTWARVPNSIQYMRQMRDDEREVDILECNSYFVHKLTSAASGVFLATAVA